MITPARARRAYKYARRYASAIRALPDTQERVTVAEDFGEMFAGDLDQFEQRLNDVASMAQDMRRGAEPADLIPLDGEDAA